MADAAVSTNRSGHGLSSIDGLVEADVRKLEAIGISDVQNLATANPILLFVETSNGIYQNPRLDSAGATDHFCRG
jgi:hypothetical protein